MTELKRRIFSVSEFSGELSKEIAELFPSVCVRGEVTNLSKPRSGHWYFALKDETNQLRAVMFRSANLRSPQISDGDEIIACGKPTIYRERGDLQLLVSHIQNAGEGELQRRFELLRQELLQAGYFDQSRKKPIPAYPTRVAVITSSSGAVIHDIQTVTARRAPALPLLLFPSEVQGEKAINSLIQALRKADAQDDIDLIILARGGGSLEDFAAFNSRELAECILNCQTPVISSVGHESDISIADLVADRRAATPSEAAEITTNGLFNLPALLQQQERQLHRNFRDQLERASARLKMATSGLRGPTERIQAAAQKLDSLEPLLYARIAALIQHKSRQLDRLKSALNPRELETSARNQGAYVLQLGQRLERAQLSSFRQQSERFQSCIKLLESVNPLGVLTRGYSISMDADRHPISSIANIKPGEQLLTRLKDGTLTSEVIHRQSLEGPDKGHDQNSDQTQ
ncbi:MAG: exodeoxyribonuclease VII large subunit [Porticoccaceae bacterium]